jgi:hypothetical protein
MARRALVGLIWCVALYFGVLYLVGAVAQNVAAVRADAAEDPATVGAEAGVSAVESSRPFIMFGVVGFVFLGSRLGFLPGTRADRSPLAKR